jgi:hypothetical protein
MHFKIGEARICSDLLLFISPKLEELMTSGRGKAVNWKDAVRQVMSLNWQMPEGSRVKPKGNYNCTTKKEDLNLY